MQRRDSRKEALELQQEFLQQAQDSLEAFQESSSAASMLRLSQTSVPHSQGSLEDAAIEGGIYLQPMENGEWAVGAAQDRPMTTLEKRLSRCARLLLVNAGASSDVRVISWFLCCCVDAICSVPLHVPGRWQS